MDRNKLLYFIVGGLLITVGYAARVMFALMFKKANEGVLILIDLLVCGGLHAVRLINIPWYNMIYDSDVGTLILGGPFQYMVLVYVLCGTALGLFFEMIIKQYNKIGLGN